MSQNFANLTYNTNATDESTTSTAETTTTTKAQITTPDTTMQTLASSVSSNGNTK